MSSVNWSEVVQKSLVRGADIRGMQQDLIDLGLSIRPFTVWQAELAGRLVLATAPFGLSLGDRACLALALDLNAPVLTADRVWQEIALELEIRVIR
jgi:PIN domain nuclease of toxin-antitoxin system